MRPTPPPPDAPRRLRAALAAALALAASASVLAQPVPPAPDAPPRPPPRAAALRPSGLGDDAAATAALAADREAFEGRVVAYVLGPDASIAGFAFDNGRQVRVPPHLGAQLAAIARPGQRVKVGARDDDGDGPPPMRTLTGLDTGRSLVDAPLADAAAPAGSAALQPIHVSGVVRQALRGPRGETNGVILDDNVQVSFPPHVAAAAGELLGTGRTIAVEGFGTRSRYGTAVQATQIGAPGGTPIAVYGRPPRGR